MKKEELQRADEKNFKEYVREEMRYIHILMNDFGLERREAIEFMRYLEIKEIEQVLSGEGEFPGISESLSVLADLTDCIGTTGKNRYFCIAGEVMQYHP